MKTPAEIVREIVDRRYAAIEAKLWEGIALGMDVAVCEDEPGNLEVVFVEPGQGPPTGRRWVIYHSSHLPYGTA